MIQIRTYISIIALLITTSAFSQITEIGLASFYADKFDGRVTASGDIFDQKKMTAAHRTLPFGSKVKVTNMNNRKTITVVINDRGPFVKDRVIDLSKEGAKRLDFIAAGVTQVKVEVLSLGESSSGSNASNTTKKKQEPKKVEKATVATSVSVATASSNSISRDTGIEYYKLESEQLTPKGYGIQVASYQEAANLMKRSAEIKKQVNKDVIIQVANSNGNKVYRIIIGTFATREAATSYNNNLKNKFNGSFIIAF